MGILVDKVRNAFVEFEKNKNPYRFAQTMFDIGDYSVHSQSNAKIVYYEILKIEKEVKQGA